MLSGIHHSWHIIPRENIREYYGYCGGLNNSPPIWPCPHPWYLWILPYMAKGTLYLGLNEGFRDREIIPVYPDESSIISRILVRGIHRVRVSNRRRWCDGRIRLEWYALKIEEAKIKEYRHLLEAEKARKMDHLLGAFRRIQPCWYPDSGPVRLISDFWLAAR